MTTIYHPEKSVILDATIGDDCTIHAPVWIGNDVIIGNRCRIQAFAFIPDGVRIGNDCFIGPGVTFTNDKYPPSPKSQWQGTWVGDRVSIGANATILPDVVIASNAVVGAGSVVTKDVLAGTIVKGNPAR